MNMMYLKWKAHACAFLVLGIGAVFKLLLVLCAVWTVFSSNGQYLRQFGLYIVRFGLYIHLTG